MYAKNNEYHLNESDLEYYVLRTVAEHIRNDIQYFSANNTSIVASSAGTSIITNNTSNVIGVVKAPNRTYRISSSIKKRPSVLSRITNGKIGMISISSTFNIQGRKYDATISVSVRANDYKASAIETARKIISSDSFFTRSVEISI